MLSVQHELGVQIFSVALPNAPFPDVYIDIFIFLLWSLRKIRRMDVQDFPNVPRILVIWTSLQNHVSESKVKVDTCSATRSML